MRWGGSSACPPPTLFRRRRSCEISSSYRNVAVRDLSICRNTVQIHLKLKIQVILPIIYQVGEGGGDDTVRKEGELKHAKRCESKTTFRIVVAKG